MPQNNQQPDLVRLIDLRTSQSQLKYSKISEIWRHSAPHVTPGNESNQIWGHKDRNGIPTIGSTKYSHFRRPKEGVYSLRTHFITDNNSNGYSVNT